MFSSGRCLALLLSFAATIYAANVRLYLKDGDYQMVREYEVQGDRVRYLSTERGEWEEMPLDLVDLKKTEKEAGDKLASQAELIRIEKAEDDAIKADKKQVANVPENIGVYLAEGSTSLKPLKEIDAFRKDSTTAKILQRIAPAPVIAGKATIFIEGKASKFRITNAEPEFFFRLAMQERLAIVKLDVKKDQRIVENVMIPPQGEDVIEEQKQMDTFKKQYGPLLYKLWPQKPLPAGRVCGGGIHGRADQPAGVGFRDR
ncbi:MAG: hypothetical protein WDO18_22410 [Acidobacteriota bacterium]